MCNDHLDKAFERMLKEAEQEVTENNRLWDQTFQRLADEWNKTAQE